MNEVCEKAQEFVVELASDLGFDLEISSEWDDASGCTIEFDGEDVDYLLSDNGEMLDAFETLLFQIFGREIEREHRFICDAGGFRQGRKAELSAMAKFAAESVREKGVSFTFGELNPSERRTIHVFLKEEDDLTSESVGMGRDRRLQIRLK